MLIIVGRKKIYKGIIYLIKNEVVIRRFKIIKFDKNFLNPSNCDDIRRIPITKYKKLL
jgi:hypothetical protein